MTDATLTADLASLRPRLAVLEPEDSDWDAGRLGWNLAHDQQPIAVAYPESVEDIVAVVNFARGHGVRVAAQATGHFAGTLAPLGDAILLKTERMRGVEIDFEGAPRARRGGRAVAGFGRSGGGARTRRARGERP